MEKLNSKLLTKYLIPHGWFYSGNVKRGLRESNTQVDENRRKACQQLGGDLKDLFFIVHKHEDTVLVGKEKDAGTEAPADAALTNTPGLLLGQGTADCGPIIVADTKGTTVAIVHSSWRTLRSDLIYKTVGELKKMNPNAKWTAVIGPTACKNCYEFGPEAEELFDQKFVAIKKGQHYVDLVGMATEQLRLAGIAEIEDTKVCTIENKRFDSHRRNGANAGRFMTLVRRV